MKSNKPTKDVIKLEIDILKKKYPDKNITKFLAEKYRVHNSRMSVWLKDFGLNEKVGRPKKNGKSY